MTERLTTEKRKIFARENITIMSMTKDELRQHYNEIFDRLQEYESAEETENTIKLPCKIGDRVYYLTGNPTLSSAPNFNRVEESKCAGFYICDNGLQIQLEYNWHGNHGTYGFYNKTVFITRAEAEKALKERSNENYKMRQM